MSANQTDPASSNQQQAQGTDSGGHGGDVQHDFPSQASSGETLQVPISERSRPPTSCPSVKPARQGSPDNSQPPHKHDGWKPATLSPLVLICFAFLSLILVAILEVLTQQSQMAGGLSLSTDSDDLSALASFGYLFLPTIVAVFYSLFWSWVDLDAKRIQPWFEMSREDGATAKDSILLTYPYDFVGFVPFRAFKNRHWPVFLSGTTMTIIMWAIVPLQAAIMATDSVIRTREVTLVNGHTFLPVSEHPMILDQSILNEAYAITWLDQSYPAFTTPDYTIMPLQLPTGELQSQTVNRNWTGTSVKYWTDLYCWPAQIARHPPRSKRTFDFLNGRGCNVSDIAAYGSFEATPYKMYYLGYQGSAYASYSLESPTCRNAQNQFLAVWSHTNGSLMVDHPNDIEIEAAFCETSYHKQPVRITISGQDLAPLEESVVPLGPVEPLTEAEFNITAFEYLLGAGVSAVELYVNRDFPFQILLEQTPRTVHLNLTWPMSPMVGFAIGSQEDLTSLHAFKNLSRLIESYTVTHKKLFPLALRRVMVDSTETSTTQGTEEIELHGIVVNRLFSGLVEGLLGLVSIFALALAWTCRKAPSSLTEDPDSLAALMDICRDSSALLDNLAGKGCLPEEELAKAVQHLRFRLVCQCQTRYGQTLIEVKVDGGNGNTKTSRLSVDRQDSAAARGHYTPIRPWPLRRPLGVLMILIMTGAMACLVYLKQQEQTRGGLVPPNGGPEVQLILLSFLPTIFATLMEPFWVLLNRFLCILQPFKDLWSGHRPAKSSINTRYTAIPPQLVLWRALGAGHFLLAMLAAVALLSNVLAVGLGGIFNQLPVQTHSLRTFKIMSFLRIKEEALNDFYFVPTIPSRPYDEPFIVIMSNISHNTTFPPWIGPDYYFQPFTLPDTQETVADAFTSTTRGFGVKPQCSPLGKFDTYGHGPLLNYTLSRRGRVVPGCRTSFRPGRLTLDIPPVNAPAGLSANEVVDTVGADFPHAICDTTLVLGWSRSSQAQNITGFMETTLLLCEPEFTTALFELTVDPKGVVLSSKQVSESDDTLDYQRSTNHTDKLIAVTNKTLKQGRLDWHNDTLSRDWMNYMLKIMPQHENPLDPHVDLPDPETMIPSIETVYRSLFALVLGLNNEIFERSPRPIRVEGLEHRTETRIFIPLPAFIMSIAVLGLDVVIAIILYGFGIKHFLPRMPTTVGSILAYVAPSRALREYDPVEERKLKPSSTFSFGRYIGDDGRAHIGVELDPYVVPLRLSSLRKGDTRPTKSLLGRITLGRRNASLQKTGADAWL